MYSSQPRAAVSTAVLMAEMMMINSPGASTWFALNMDETNRSAANASANRNAPRRSPRPSRQASAARPLRSGRHGLEIREHAVGLQQNGDHVGGGEWRVEFRDAPIAEQFARHHRSGTLPVPEVNAGRMSLRQPAPSGRTL